MPLSVSLDVLCARPSDPLSQLIARWCPLARLELERKHAEQQKAIQSATAIVRAHMRGNAARRQTAALRRERHAERQQQLADREKQTHKKMMAVRGKRSGAGKESSRIV